MGRKLWLGTVLLALAPGLFDANEPERHADPVQHFLYGSIGAEERAGIPYWVWLVLPEVFPDLLPARPGRGYERLGFVYESPDRKRPMGTSRRQRQAAMVGLNCAVCHTGVIRDAPGGPARVIPGMPAHQLDLQGYFRFLAACARDRRFNADVLLEAIRKADPEFSWLDALAYGLFVIPRTREGILEQARQLEWLDRRPPLGAGRVDTFNPYKVLFGFDMKQDDTVGAADFPPLFHQKLRDGMWLHWDGNNDKVEERNKSAAIGAGCSEDSLDLAAMKRVADWIWELRPPEFPRDRIDAARAARGKPVYEKYCASCHAAGGEFTGQITDIAQIGTDPERLRSFTAPLAEKMNTLGTGRPWKFTRFRKTNGYANMPLDGVWLRAPYLHNGSVPTLRDLLSPPDQRPAVFYRGCDVYDFDNVGFVSAGPEAERSGVRFDTTLRGNGRQGHVYGTDLKADQKEDLLAYLKTL
jgi:mono/diheme cytochrome c family protein